LHSVKQTARGSTTEVRQLAHDGWTTSNVSTGAVLTHGSQPNSLEFTPEELQAAVDEAKNFGLRVMVHAHATKNQERHPRGSRVH